MARIHLFVIIRPFLFLPSGKDANGPASLLWSTGDISNPLVTGNIESDTIIKAILTDSFNCPLVLTKYVEVNKPQIVDQPDKAICLNKSYTFNPVVNLDKGNNVWTYQWYRNSLSNFLSYNQNLQFNKTGIYFLRVKDDLGCEDTDTIIVSQLIDNLSVTTETGHDTLCQDQGNMQLLGSPAGGTWSGIGLVNQDQFKTSLSAGLYELYYEYIDNNCKAIDTLKLLLSENPHVNIDKGKLENHCPGAMFSYTLKSVDGHHFIWQQGVDADGQFTGNTSDSSIQYIPGNNDMINHGFFIRLTAYDSIGYCTFSDSVRSEIYHLPEAEFQADPLEGAFPLSVQFSNLSKIDKGNIASYIWDFGDGYTSVLVSPVHVYDQKGNFDVRLLAVSNYGCRDSLIKSNLISTWHSSMGDIISENSIRLIPNPASHTSYLYTDLKSIQSVKMYDLNGKMIRSWTGDEITLPLRIDRKHLKNSLYLLKIIAEDQVYTKNIIYK